MDINYTELTSNAANQFFGKSSNYWSNLVFENTLRFIALKHCDGGIENIKMFTTDGGSADGYSTRSGNDFINSGSKVNISIYQMQSGYEPLEIDADGWVSLNTAPYPVSLLLSKISNTNVFVNKEEKRVIIFVKRTTEKWFDELSSSLFRILTWVYPDNDSISDEEKALFRALHERDSTKFEQIINDFAKQFDFKNNFEKKILLGWTKGLKDKQIALLNKNAENSRAEIERLSRKLDEQYNILKSTFESIEGLRYLQDKDDGKKFYDFFRGHKQLSLMYTNEESNNYKYMTFSIVDTIEYFDDVAFGNMWENKQSIIYDSAYNNSIRNVLYGLFKLRKGYVRAQSIFQLTNMSSLSAIRGQVDENLTVQTLRHPHLYHHACLGGNKQYIEEYMLSGDWDMAIEQAIAATKNINFGDSIVFPKFIKDLMQSMNKKIIIIEDGSELTPNEFLEYIKNDIEEANNE